MINIIRILRSLILLIERLLEFIIGMIDVIIPIVTLGFYEPLIMLWYERMYWYNEIIFGRWHTQLATLELRYMKDTSIDNDGQE